MKNIESFLGKFRKMSDDNGAVTEAAVETLKAELSLDIKKDAVRVRGKTLFIKISGAAKLEVRTTKGLLVRKINQRLGGDFVSDIR